MYLKESRVKIIRPYAMIMNNNNLKFASSNIEYAARVSHRSEEMQAENTAQRFLHAVVIGHGDWSVVEHASVSVEMVVDRGITHELVRHRLFAFTQESTRFVNYAKKMPPSFIYPKTDIECEHCLNGVEIRVTGSGQRPMTWLHVVDSEGRREFCAYDPLWLYAINEAETAYKDLINQGWRPQEARSVFPNALASKIIVTGNLRNWRHFFLMRTTKETHPQMRQVTIPLLSDFQENVPILFDDIIPEMRQVENIAKGR